MQCRFCKKEVPNRSQVCSMACQLNYQYKYKQSLNAQSAESDFLTLKEHYQKTEGTLLPSIDFEDPHLIAKIKPVIDNDSPKIIGKGSFSTVYLYKNHSTNQLYAVKKIKKDNIDSKPELIHLISNEIAFQSRIKHKNIIELYHAEESLFSYDLVLEYAPKGTLFTMIKASKHGLSEQTAANYLIQLLSAINFLHQNNIIHRDIKPENCLIDDNDNVKLCDFGNCCQIDIGFKETVCGTFEYMAPELIRHKSYNKPIDIWALGVLLYEMLHRFSPFQVSDNQNDIEQICDNILNKPLIFHRKLSKDCKELICLLLEPDQNKRITINDIFKHPFITKYHMICDKETIKPLDNIDCTPTPIHNDETESSEFLNNVISQMKTLKKKKSIKENISTIDLIITPKHKVTQTKETIEYKEILIGNTMTLQAKKTRNIHNNMKTPIPNHNKTINQDILMKAIELMTQSKVILNEENCNPLPYIKPKKSFWDNLLTQFKCE